MFFFCLIGCPTKFKQSSDAAVRVCPKCHNNSVVSGKTRTWLEICFVPLVPIHSANIWICSICNWEIKQEPGKLEPARAGYPGAQARPTSGYQPGHQQQGFAQAYPAQK